MCGGEVGGRGGSPGILVYAWEEVIRNLFDGIGKYRAEEEDRRSLRPGRDKTQAVVSGD